jgi:hypothetical protein
VWPSPLVLMERVQGRGDLLGDLFDAVCEVRAVPPAALSKHAIITTGSTSEQS